MSPGDAVTKALEASPRPLSFVELTHPVREATGRFPTRGEMMSVLSRLVSERRITRRPVAPADGEGAGKLAAMDVQLCDFHPAGRDPWPYGVGFSQELPCPVCGVYVTYTDDGPDCTACAKRGDS